MSAYERESLAVDRAANRLAEAANAVSSAQREYAFWQLILAGFGVAFTAIAAVAAIAAARYAKDAAKAARDSADADNAALAETLKAAAAARQDATEAAARFEQQMAKQQEMVEFTAKSAYAMDHSATATRGMARAMKENAEAAVKAVEASNVQLDLSRKAFVADQRPWVGVFGISLDRLEIDEAGATLKLTLNLRNTGRTPAHRLGIKARMRAEQRPDATVQDVIQRFETQPRATDPDDAVACVFPQQDYISEFSVRAARADIDAFPIVGIERLLIFTLSGFVLYESEVSGVTGVHATSFIYRIYRGAERHILLNSEETYLRLDGNTLKANPWPHGWLAD